MLKLPIKLPIYRSWIQRKLIVQKCLEMLLICTDCIFLHQTIKKKDKQKSFVFCGQLLSNFRYKKQLLAFLGITFEQLFEKFRETFCEISIKLSKALNPFPSIRRWFLDQTIACFPLFRSLKRSEEGSKNNKIYYGPTSAENN